jgi:aldehyde dehydrogenase (NAD+)
MSSETSFQECSEAVERLRCSFRAGKSKTYASRRKNILGLKKFLTECEDEICAAMNKDLGRGRYEAIVFEILPTLSDLDFVLGHLQGWMQPVEVSSPVALLPASSKIISEPYGVALIIGPFNYPIQLLVSLGLAD